MREVGAPEPIAPAERLTESEVLDDRRRNREPDEPEPRDCGQDRGNREERDEEVDRDSDQERPKERAPLGPHSGRNQARADI